MPVSGTSNATFRIGGSVPTVWYEVVFRAAVAVGEGNHIFSACAAYCVSVSASLPTCHANVDACIEDCATWTSDTLGGRCDCTTEVDAVFTCSPVRKVERSFSSNQITAIAFGNTSAGALDFWVDDVVLLKVN